MFICGDQVVAGAVRANVSIRPSLDVARMLFQGPLTAIVDSTNSEKWSLTMDAGKTQLLEDEMDQQQSKFEGWK